MRGKPVKKILRGRDISAAGHCGQYIHPDPCAFSTAHKVKLQSMMKVLVNHTLPILPTFYYYQTRPWLERFFEVFHASGVDLQFTNYGGSLYTCPTISFLIH